jgi:hypothetical protein
MMLTRRNNAALLKETGILLEKIEKKIKTLIQKQKYIGYKKIIDTTGVTQISTSILIAVNHDSITSRSGIPTKTVDGTTFLLILRNQIYSNSIKSTALLFLLLVAVILSMAYFFFHSAFIIKKQL